MHSMFKQTLQKSQPEPVLHKQMYGFFNFVSKTIHVPDEQNDVKKKCKSRVLFDNPEMNC